MVCTTYTVGTQVVIAQVTAISAAKLQDFATTKEIWRVSITFGPGSGTQTQCKLEFKKNGAFYGYTSVDRTINGVTTSDFYFEKDGATYQICNLD